MDTTPGRIDGSAFSEACIEPYLDSICTLLPLSSRSASMSSGFMYSVLALGNSLCVLSWRMNALFMVPRCRRGVRR